jgi:hypothetical protein
MCIRANDLLHISHENGCAPACNCLCTLSRVLCFKDVLHIEMFFFSVEKRVNIMNVPT